MDQNFEASQVRLMTKEFVVLSLEIAKGQMSCPRRLVLRGRLKLDLPTDIVELRSFFLEHGSPWSVLKVNDDDLVRQTRTVFQNMDVILLLKGAGYIECLGEKFKSPILAVTETTPVISSYTYKYWHAGDDGYKGTRWVSTEETQMYILRTNEMIYWNRKGFRLKAGEKLKVDKQEGFLRTRFALILGKLKDNIQNKELQSTIILAINSENEFECIEDCICVLLWI